MDPSLAIHLDRQENFAFNKETQLFPIAGLIAAELNRNGGVDLSSNELNKVRVVTFCDRFQW
jgi:aspartyl aminopeptidase